MEKEVGKVRINLEYYHGDDHYSDGDAVEEKLLEIVKEKHPDEFRQVIESDGTWAVMYHLSPMRENIINWYPFQEGDHVLELGAGCGAVTGAMLSKGVKVTAVDLSLRRSMINAYRHRDDKNLNVIVGSLQDILEQHSTKYDYATLIGVLEYSALFTEHPKPFHDVLSMAQKVLKPNGKLLLSIENKLGLKYFAGCREDHTGRFFESIEGYPHKDGPYTFSRKELKKLAAEVGFECRFYYPYPDYKFPVQIFSDEYLPQKGDLVRNWQNFDADRIALFDESKAFDTIIEAGLFNEFSNSFFIEMERRKDI